MKTIAAITGVLATIFGVVALATICFVAGAMYGTIKTAEECAKMVVEDAHAITSKGRVITDVRQVSVGRNDFRVEFIHRPRPFYFPDDAGKAAAKP